uniref:Uncharacterized protein n=1 Tax=viral metagenome TaxID=1070528 RepID=A0A6C0E6K2_9ZZZZ
MFSLVSTDDLYKILIRHNTCEISCQTLPGSSHCGTCPDKHILTFDEFGYECPVSFASSIRNGFNKDILSKGYCYQIKELPYGKTIETLDQNLLKQYYRLICFNCDYEYYITYLRTNFKGEFEKIIYMNIDRENDNMCKGITSRLHLCKNNAVYGYNFCSAHKDQKIDGITYKKNI